MHSPCKTLKYAPHADPCTRVLCAHASQQARSPAGASSSPACSGSGQPKCARAASTEGGMRLGASAAVRDDRNTPSGDLLPTRSMASRRASRASRCTQTAPAVWVCGLVHAEAHVCACMLFRAQ